MVEKDIFVTDEGLAKLEEELEELKTVRRKEVAERIKVAIGYGDLSENSEYDEAKNEQAQLEERIATLENKLTKVKIISKDDIDEKTVGIGNAVEVKRLDTKKKDKYYIVGSSESNPLEKKVSNESPIGRGLLGHKVGDVVEIEIPSGLVNFEILNIAIGE